MSYGSKTIAHLLGLCGSRMQFISFRSKFWRVFSLSVMPSHSKISLSLITHLTPLQPSFYLNLHSHTLSLSLWVQDSRMGTYYNGGRPAARKPKYSWKQTAGQRIVVFQIQRANQRITRTKIRERERERARQCVWLEWVCESEGFGVCSVLHLERGCVCVHKLGIGCNQQERERVCE